MILILKHILICNKTKQTKQDVEQSNGTQKRQRNLCVLQCVQAHNLCSPIYFSLTQDRLTTSDKAFNVLHRKPPFSGLRGPVEWHHNQMGLIHAQTETDLSPYLHSPRGGPSAVGIAASLSSSSCAT